MYSITECDDKHTLVGNEEGGCLWQIVTVAEVKWHDEGEYAVSSW